MRIKLLLIDFDGTLVDTRQSNFCAYRDVLAEVGVTLDEETYLKDYFGMRCGEFMRLLGLTDSYQIDGLRRRKIDIYPKYFNLITLNNPLWEFAQSFRNQGGKVWIVSTGQASNIENVMKYFNLGDKVDGVITGSDVKNSKPSPECFHKAMLAEGITASESLVFEDSIFGIKAAQECGANYIKVEL